jgi:cysteinyl-tRNA synthetase
MVSIRLHNTLSRQKEVFIPADSQRVTMYVCGPTVYNYVHIGNARPVVVFDVLYRLLSRHYPRVIYARNITDVDDKINAAAAANGEPIRILAERYATAYREDMTQLNALPPTIEPWATGHIPQMIALIERLIERSHAYVAEGHVLFHVPSLPDYGKLSGRQHRRHGCRGAGRSRTLQARPGRFRALEAVDRSTARLGQPLGLWAPRVAHGMYGDDQHPPRPVDRHPRRRPGPDLSPP